MNFKNGGLLFHGWRAPNFVLCREGGQVLTSGSYQGHMWGQARGRGQRGVKKAILYPIIRGLTLPLESISVQSLRSWDQGRIRTIDRAICRYYIDAHGDIYERFSQ